MTRLTLGLAAWVGLATVATASMTAATRSPALVNEILRPRAAKAWERAGEIAAMQSAKSEYTVTDKTEILLDGKPCEYARVPSHASIVYMEVAADKKTVLRIHFQIGK